ncbi:MAG: hypothetical protein U0Q03_15790 [Acidimicrobiales bacterium]
MSIDARGALTVAVLALTLVGCGDDEVTAPAASRVEPPSAPTVDAVIATSTIVASESDGCRLPAAGNVAGPGECTLVDWNVVSVAGTTVELEYFVNDPGCSLDLDRVEIVETPTSVTLRVLVGRLGDEGASCPTALGSRSTTVDLAAPLGDRVLLGCRTPDSFAPAGGYNDPEPRDPDKDCSPA